METANILICEDERIIARDIENSLARSGYNVVGIASNAEQALKLAEKNSPDLALMDIGLKGNLSGIKVAELLSSHYSIPSIYLTSHADEKTLQQAKATLPLSYLLKPFDEEALRTALEIGLYRHREQRKEESLIQNRINNLYDANAIEKVVELERELLEVEKTNSQIRVGFNIARRLKEELSMTTMLVESAANDSSIEVEYRNSLKVALIHQDNVMEIVTKLLYCSESEQLNLEQLPVNSVIEEAMHEVKCLVKAHVKFINCLSLDCEIVSIDRNIIREALVNVMLNAYQSMNKDPIITISTDLVYEEIPELFNRNALPGWYVVINIGDQGIGMDQAHIDRIFEPCFSTASPSSCVGMGLSITHSIMQWHKGWIKIHSVPQRGTDVLLYLPCPGAPNNPYGGTFGQA